MSKKKNNIRILRNIVGDGITLSPDLVLRSARRDKPSHVVVVTVVDGEYFVASSHGERDAIALLEVGKAQLVNTILASDD